MRVLSSAEMQACDLATAEQFGISTLRLMRNAAAAIASFTREQFPHARRVTVLCGRGNNGGDGLMAAPLLAAAGAEVMVLLLGDPEGLKGDAAQAWREIQGTSCQVSVVTSAEDLTANSNRLDTDLLIDAVVGTGFKPPLRGLAQDAITWAKSSSAPVLAVDLPSGWEADATHAAAEEDVLQADAVITFTAPKPAHVFGELTRRWNQPVVVAPIGSPPEAMRSDLEIEWAGSAQSLYAQPRPADSNKGKFGHVLVVGGTFGPAGGKAGAPSMSSLAAMRVGAGLVTAAVPAPALPVVSGFAPELMTQALKATPNGDISAENANPDRLAALLKGITVLAIGPGMGQSTDTKAFFRAILDYASLPVVIDADGLNILAESPGLLGDLTKDHRSVVLTPHPGEMARLAGVTTKEVQADRLALARSFARQNRVILVLKGSRTLIAYPDGKVAVNTTGNPAMAKGGSGDLLTGILAGMLAQNPKAVERAVEAGVFLHGLVADLTVRRMDEHTMLATDTLPYLSEAFHYRSTAANGYVWLQGLPACFAGQRSNEAAG